jgi:hypothetical protein
MIKKVLFSLFILIFMPMTGSVAAGQETVSNEHFSLRFSPDGIASLKFPHDAYDTDYIAQGETLGDVSFRYRIGNGKKRRSALTSRMGRDGRRKTTDPMNNPPRYKVIYKPAQRYDWGDDLELTERFRAEGEALVWTLHFRNLTDEPIEIGDIALSLPFNTSKGWDRSETETRRVIAHRFISGHGSFIFWMRPNSVGPYLVMVPLVKCPSFESASTFRATKLEYSRGAQQRFERRGEQVYIHSAFSGTTEQERVDTWRQPHTSITLAPMLTPGSEVTYGFKFRWADGYDGVRDVLYEEGLFDVNIVPGMTVPEDLEAMLSLRTKNVIKSVTPEYPDQTKIEYLGAKRKDVHIYRVKFFRLGENLLTVNYGEGQQMVLEFFVTEPLETLIKKRAAFLVTKQLIRDPSKWYDGLIGEWNMRDKKLITPDTPGHEEDYHLTHGDFMLTKAPYIPAKNVHFPSQKEVEAVDYHIKNYFWGKMQLTDKEGPLPYGIYALPNWKICRESRGATRPGSWKEHISRAYDYPHYIVLYFSMYRVAKNYPELKTELTKEEYLQRAFGTAKAYFTLPDKRDPLIHALWYNKCSAQTTGMYNELVIIDLIEELYANGKKDEADWLKGEWEKKVEYFIKDDPYLWGSEFAFDPTGFESTHALAKYAMENAFKPGSRLGMSYEEVNNFMEKQIQANIVARGWLETAYYLLGGERALRYMSQCGGWSVLDYALYYAKDPAKYLRLGYAAYLSSWALMNTGTPESDYGFWYPGKENDGGAGTNFRGYVGPGGRQIQRGARPQGGEINLGFTGALRTSATVVMDDPLFGLFAYGGQLTRNRSAVNVIPRDGLRERFHIIRGGQRFHMLLTRDGFAQDKPIVFNESLNEVRFTLESRSTREHVTELKVSGLPAGTYQVTADGLSILTFAPEKDEESVIMLSVGEKKESDIVIRRIKR